MVSGKSMRPVWRVLPVHRGEHGLSINPRIEKPWACYLHTVRESGPLNLALNNRQF